ncbi:TRAP transporter small permease [Pararhodobacter zhoushanensis]|uniref:TRAP transporter small permease n=1 Tax=Pararhodobacter zhoushanensis TaxID=2479545 RepID=UPI001FE3C031|nr:TRAP transporter small permease [Pararhodobacter zhoushanensis]
MVKILENFCRVVEMLAGLLLGLCTILIVASAIGRYALTSPIPDSFDVSRLLLGACIMWGFASVGYRGGHITVDLFVEMMPERVRRWVELLAWLVLLFFVILLTWKMFTRVESAMRSNEATFDLRFPVWPLMALIWAGTAISIVTITVRMFLLATGKADPEFERDAAQKVD